MLVSLFFDVSNISMFISTCLLLVLIVQKFTTRRRHPCNIKGRVEESKEACENFEKEITLVQDFGRGNNSALFMYRVVNALLFVLKFLVILLVHILYFCLLNFLI